MTKLYQQIADDNAYALVTNKDVSDWDKMSDSDKYDLASFLLERDPHTEGMGPDNRDFDKMLNTVLRCLRNPTQAAKIDMADVFMDCVTTYYERQAKQVIETVNGKRELFREHYDYEE